jgi:hypothetical protein
MAQRRLKPEQVTEISGASARPIRRPKASSTI